MVEILNSPPFIQETKLVKGFLLVVEDQKTIRFTIPSISQTKPIVVEYKNSTWKVWTAYNPNLDKGTFFALLNDGTIERTTILPDDTQLVTTL